MAFGMKYWFEFVDFYDRTCKVELYKDPYSSTIYEIENVAASPFQVSSNADDDKFKTIIGKEFTINLVAETDGQWDEFFNITYREWYVKYYISASIFMEGYLIPDMYMEPYADPPYYVSLRGTDQLADLKEHELLTSGIPYTGDEYLGTIIANCLQYTGLLDATLAPGLDFISSFNIFEENNAGFGTQPDDPLDLQKVVDYAIFYDEDGKSNVYNILDKILSSINCRLYYNIGQWEIMHIPQLFSSSFLYRDFFSVGGAHTEGTINNHQITISNPASAITNVWVDNNMMLSVLPPLLEFKVKQIYNWRKNIIRNPEFNENLIIADKPFYWTTSYTISSGEYKISNGKLLIEKISGSRYNLLQQDFGTFPSGINYKIKFQAAIKTAIGSIRITLAGTTWDITSDTTIDWLSGSLSLTSFSLIIYSIQNTLASYAIISGLSIEVVPDTDNWFPESKEYIGSGDSDNRLKKSIDINIGDKPTDADITGSEVPYDGSLVSYYWISAIAKSLNGFSWLWKRTGGTIYNTLAAFNVLDRITNYEIPTYKLTGAIKSSEMDWRKCLIDGKLSGRVFMQSRMTYNAIEATWAGDWLEIKDEETMPTLTFTLAPTSWNPDQAAQSQVVTVTATDGIIWEAFELTGVAWLSITNPIGSGSGSFTIVVTQNTSGGSRNETVRIKGTGIAYHNLVVTQAPI